MNAIRIILALFATCIILCAAAGCGGDDDDDGFVHIGYFLQDSGVLKYATNVFGQWQTTHIDSYCVVGDYSSIVVDDEGMLHVSYYGVEALWHAKFNRGCTQMIPTKR